MLWRYNIQEEILGSSHNILKTDYFDTHAEIVTLQRCGRSVSFDQVCPRCSRQVISFETVPHSGITIFNCGHIYHDACVTDNRCDECLDWDSIEEELNEKTTVNNKWQFLDKVWKRFIAMYYMRLPARTFIFMISGQFKTPRC